MARSTHFAFLGITIALGTSAVLAACGDSATSSSSSSSSGGTPTKDAGPTPTVDGGVVALEGLREDWRELAGGYLEARADKWVKSPPKISNVPCAMSCHTTFPYTLAKHTIATKIATPAADSARAAFEARVALGANATPFYGSNGDAKTKESLATEALLNGVALGMDDVWNKKPLSDASKSALSRMFTQQGANGTWAWLEYKLEPWETRNDFGAAMSLMLLGSIPDDSAPGQADAKAKALTYVRGQLGTMALHDRVVLLWTSSFMKDALTAEQRSAIADEVVSKQLEDGGFSSGGWGKGALAKTVAATSDGYATAIAALALCTEASRKDSAYRALAWLAKNQADDGSWPGQSVNTKDAQNKLFMTDASTAYAVLALTQCGGR